MPEMEQNNQKKVLALQIIALELATTNSYNLEQNTCHWQSICYETPLRFAMSVKEIFCQSRFLRVMKKYYGSAFMQALYNFGTP